MNKKLTILDRINGFFFGVVVFFVALFVLFTAGRQVYKQVSPKYPYKQVLADKLFAASLFVVLVIFIACELIIHI
jgi:membrane protease YdiL (CAAX protease family)